MSYMIRLKIHMIINLFPIKIHVWGGFGSQLFALALVFHLKEKFRTRKLILIYHTSGVTKRTWDLPFNLVDTTVIVKNDFKLLNIVKKPNLFLNKLSLSRFFKFFYGLVGFYSDCNTTSKTRRIKPWVIDIRGHYSHRNISFDTLSSILDMLQKHYGSEFKRVAYSPISAIQYRLGDLLELKTKSFVSGKAITNLVDQNVHLWPQKNFDLYSDSLEIASSLLPNFSLIPNECTPHETVWRCLDYKFFIGTNSKLTIWIVLFRLLKDSNSYNFVPNILKSELSQCIRDSHRFQNLIYYG